MSFNFTFDQWRRAVEEVVFENPGYVYERVALEHGGCSCMYTTMDGRPSCLIGHAALRLSSELFNQVSLAESVMDEGETFGVNEIENHIQIDIDARTLGFLTNLQAYQDGGTSWGECLKHAEEMDHMSVVSQAWVENEEYDAGSIED